MSKYLAVTYRDIAKMLASALPLDGEDFRAAVESHLATIKALPAATKTAMKVAFVFSRKVNREDREDMFQELALAVLKVKTPDEKLAYTIARFDWLNWWRKRHTHTVKTCGYSGRDTDRHHDTCQAIERPSNSCRGCGYAGTASELVSIDTVSEDTSGNPSTIGELIIGQCDFELKTGAEIDARAIYAKLPDKIRAIVSKRLLGQSLNGKERFNLHYWIKTQGYKLLLA